MEPRIRYAQTEDGIRIAFATYREGDPLIWVMNPVGSHVQLEWQQPLFRAAISDMAAERMVIRFDQRGVGLSDRDVHDVSLDARVRDLETVVDHLKLNTFKLLALENGGHPAIAYAAKHPERVLRLILLNCFPRGGDASQTARGEALAGMEGDWELLTDTVGTNAYGVNSEDGRRYGEFLRACVTHEMWLRLGKADKEIDVSDLLPLVRSPTLVIRHSGIKWLSMDATRELAATIPDARLVVIEGLYPDNPQQLMGAIGEFLGDGLEAETESEGLSADIVHTILFTDVEGSTALTQRLGDARARELLREHERIVREALKSHSGSEVKTMGDGFMASFSSATKALECAITMQRAFAEWNEGSLRSKGSPLRQGSGQASTGSGRTVGVGSGRAEEIRVRIGLNAGEPIAEDDPDGRSDLFGTAVNLAARIAAKAEGGQILTSDTVRGLVAGKKFLFSDRGETAMRGFEDPVKLYELSWRES